MTILNLRNCQIMMGIDMCSEGILMTFPALYILYNQGTKCDVAAGFKALDQTLALVKNEYPEISYYGYIGFVDLENEMYQKEIVSNESVQVKKYGFVADAMGQINDEIDKYIDIFRDSWYEENDSDGNWVWDVINAFHLYEDKISLSIYNMIMSTTCEHIEDDDVYDSLEGRIAEWKKAAGYIEPDDEEDDDGSDL